MDSLLNAGKAAGFAAAKGKTLRVKTVEARFLDKIGEELDSALIDISKKHDVVWVDVKAAVNRVVVNEAYAFIYYTER